MKGIVVDVTEDKSIVLFNDGKIASIPTPPGNDNNRNANQKENHYCGVYYRRSRVTGFRYSAWTVFMVSAAPD